jgi:hypothetical protein
MLRMLRWGCYVQMLASSLFCFGNWQFSHSLVERDVVNVGLELCSCLLTCLALRIALFFHCPLSHLSLASSRVVWTVSWDWLVERFRVAASEKNPLEKSCFFWGGLQNIGRRRTKCIWTSRIHKNTYEMNVMKKGVDQKQLKTWVLLQVRLQNCNP